MICPYCTTDIEPIELGGKLFCSNCGLAISAVQTKPAELPKITNLYSTGTENDEGKQSPVDQPVEEKATPKPEEPTISELLSPKMDIANSNPDKDENEVLNPLTKEAEKEVAPAVKIAVADEPKTEVLPEVTVTPKPESIPVAVKEPKEETIAENEIEKPQIEQPIIEAKSDSVSKEIIPNSLVTEAPMPTKDKGVLLDILNSKTESTTIGPEEQKDEKAFSETVKSIDTLGASGILLDILSDEAVKKSKEQEKEALEAASELIKEVKVSEKIETKPEEKDNKSTRTKETDQVYRPKDGIKLTVNVLDDNIVNPVTHPEIEAAPEELDLPTPEETKKETEQLAQSEPEPIEPKNPEEALDLNQAEENELDKKVEEIFQPSEDTKGAESVDIDLSDLPSVKAKKKGQKNKAHILNDEISEDIELPKEAEEEKDIEIPNERIKTVPKPNIGLSADSHSHLTNYFNNILGNENQNSKKKKGKKSNKEKHENSQTWIVVLLIILLLIASGIIYYIYLNQTKQPTVQTTSPTTLGNINLPKEIPYGYQLSSDLEFVNETQTLQAVYVSTLDKNKKIIFDKQKSEDPAKLLKENTSSESKKSEEQTINDIKYTIFEDGSIFWVKNDYYYSIMVQNDTIDKESMINMAKTTE